MKKIVVTGASGFVGAHMVEELEKNGYLTRQATLENCDVTNPGKWRDFLVQDLPDAVVHLAALSGYDQCHADPRVTWQVNTSSLEAVVAIFSELNPGGRFLFVSSGKIYRPSESPLTESSSLEPADFYALTKLAADLRLEQLAKELPLTILRARSFNHTGPGQSLGFLCPDLVSRLKASSGISKDVPLEVGSLSAQLDLSDVRDIARGYRLFLERGYQGDVLNFGSGRLITVQDVVSTLAEVTKFSIRPKETSCHDRPYTQALRWTDISRAQTQLGWQPEISLKTTLRDLWNHA